MEPRKASCSQSHQLVPHLGRADAGRGPAEGLADQIKMRSSARGSLLVLLHVALAICACAPSAHAKSSSKNMDRELAAKRRECERQQGVGERCRSEQIDIDNCLMQ